MRRDPIGKLGESLNDVSDFDLGVAVIEEAIGRVGLQGHEIDEVIMTHGFRTGNLPPVVEGISSRTGKNTPARVQV